MKKTSAAAGIAATSLMLFSMFFGAGNLIFPPMLGAGAGFSFTPAITGFLLTGVLLPVVSVIAVAITGLDVKELAARGGKVFGIIFPILAYLSLGAFYALPRTAVVSFSTAVTPLTGWDSRLAGTIFAAIFFAVSLALAYDPSGLVDKLGKYLTPLLLILLVALISFTIIRLPANDTHPSGDYAFHPMAAGLIQGYMTMDSLAALAFGIMIVTTLKSLGVSTGPALVRGASVAAVCAGALLAIIYIGLGLMGLHIPNPSSYPDGTVLLTDASRLTLGTPGMVLFGLIVLLACLSTAAGLIGATCAFFHRICPKVSYRMWSLIFSLSSLAVASLGLKEVLAIAAPIIGFLYPAAITLVFLTIVEPVFRRRLHWTFTLSLAVSVIWALLMSLDDLGWGSSFIDPLISWAPAHDQHLGWFIPTVVATLVGWGLDLWLLPSRAVPVGGELQLEAELRGGQIDRKALGEAAAQGIDVTSLDEADITIQLADINRRIDALDDTIAAARIHVDTLKETRDLAATYKEELLARRMGLTRRS